MIPRQRALLVVEGHQHDRQVFEQLLKPAFAGPQRGFQFFHRPDVRKGEHPAVDEVLRRPVRHNPQQKPLPALGFDLHLLIDERFQDLLQIFLQAVVLEIGRNIADRAAHVPGDQN